MERDPGRKGGRSLQCCCQIDVDSLAAADSVLEEVKEGAEDFCCCWVDRQVHCISNIWFAVLSRQGDQGTTKVGKRISRVVLTVRATGFIQCGRGMLRQRLPEHAMPTLDGGCVKPVAKTFERALDMRFPTFVVS